MTQPTEKDNLISTSIGGNTFLIRIMFRQNASWQGTIQWLEGKKTKSFRSFLEMTMLIQQALALSQNEEASPAGSIWKEEEGVS